MDNTQSKISKIMNYMADHYVLMYDIAIWYIPTSWVLLALAYSSWKNYDFTVITYSLYVTLGCMVFLMLFVNFSYDRKKRRERNH